LRRFKKFKGLRLKVQGSKFVEERGHYLVQIFIKNGCNRSFLMKLIIEENGPEIILKSSLPD
jgi:hypothetical protein